MNRTGRSVAILAVMFIASAIVWVAPAAAGTQSLADQLRDSRRELARAEVRLHDAELSLEAALLSHDRGAGLFVRQVKVARRAVRFWRDAISDLRVAQAGKTLAELEKSGAWRPLIEHAAKKYGVNADGLYQLMMLESGGKRKAVGAGRFYGLFQYSIVTWQGDWNPWRSESVFDGSAQIEASAYAVKKGMGRSLWGNTFPVAF